MKTMSAWKAKNAFGLMIDTARASLASKSSGASLWSSSAFPRDLSARRRRRHGYEELRKLAAEAFARVHQTACIDILCREIAAVRRKLLVEMAGGTAMYSP
jgi:hypothetical protein